MEKLKNQRVASWEIPRTHWSFHRSKLRVPRRCLDYDAASMCCWCHVRSPQVWQRICLTQSGWWFQSLWKILVNWDDDIPNIWENKKCFKPPTSNHFSEILQSGHRQQLPPPAPPTWGRSQDTFRSSSDGSFLVVFQTTERKFEPKVYYPLEIKCGNGKLTIYRWFSY